MSGYSEDYYKLHKDEIERENKAEDYRKKLIDEISIDDMVKILFTNFIKKQDASEVIKIGKEYF